MLTDAVHFSFMDYARVFFKIAICTASCTGEMVYCISLRGTSSMCCFDK